MFSTATCLKFGVQLTSKFPRDIWRSNNIVFQWVHKIGQNKVKPKHVLHFVLVSSHFCCSSEYVLTYTCLLDLMGQNPGTFSFTSICLGFTDVHPLNMWYLNVLCRFRPIHPLDLWEFNSWLWKSWPIDDTDGYLSLNMMTFHCYIYIYIYRGLRS